MTKRHRHHHHHPLKHYQTHMPRQIGEPILDNNRAGGEYTEYTQITCGKDKQGWQKAHFHIKGGGSLDVTESPSGLTYIREQDRVSTESHAIPTASISTVATTDEIVGMAFDLEKVCNAAGSKFKGPTTGSKFKGPATPEF